jgi:hypothetical protein
MGKTATNIAIVLGLITIVFAGYYLYSQQGSFLVSDEAINEQTMTNMLNNTQAFIGYRQTLDKINLDLKILEDRRFSSLRSYSRPIEEQPVGRSNPFSATLESNNNQP